MRKRKWVIAASVLLLLLLAFVAFVVKGLFHVPDSSDYDEQAHALQRAVDEYRLRTGHLPYASDEATMRELGFDYGAGPIPEFDAIDGTRYLLTYNYDFDGPCWRFDSSSNAWAECPVPNR